MILRAAGLPVLIALLLAGGAGCTSSNTEKIPREGGESAGAPPASRSTEGPATGPTESVHGLAWDLPEGFRREQPASSMRMAQYRLPAAEEGADGGELAVFFFGPGVGGSTEANLQRWAGQFLQSDGSDPVGKAVKEEFTTKSGLKVTTISLTGHYQSSNMGSGPSYDQADWALYGAVIEGQGGPWFFKAVGPEAVIHRYHDALHGLYHGVRLGS